MKLTKKTTALLLTLVMTTSLFGGTALAQDDITGHEYAVGQAVVTEGTQEPDDVRGNEAAEKIEPGQPTGETDELSDKDSQTAEGQPGKEEDAITGISETDEIKEDTEEADLQEEEGTEEADLQDGEEEDTEAQAEAEPYISTYSIGAEVFSDVRKSDWFYSYVSYVLNKGIMTGMGDNMFSPSSELSRAQFATVLYRIDGREDVSYSGRFPDVPDGTFFTKAVLWASRDEVAVISGYEDGRFGSSDMITREQLVTMMYRYAQYKGCQLEKGKSLNSFPDVAKVSSFAKESMQWAVGSGIIKGDQGSLNPQGNTSRAVCATIIQRFCETFLPGQLPDIEISAGVGKVTVSNSSKKDGTFKVTVSDVTASQAIRRVQVPAWCSDDQSDLYWYTATRQSNGTYAFTGDVKNHGYHVGTYKLLVYVELEMGIRLKAGEQSAKIEGSAAKMRVDRHVENVYSEVGKDLNACYWWVVNNVSYYTLPIPLDPPEGFTRAQWYSIWAFEQHRGNCYCYAAAFYFLAKGLGYDAEFVEGQVGMASGGYGPHGWVVINIDGASYICDPEAQAEIGIYNFYIQPINSPVLQYRW